MIQGLTLAELLSLHAEIGDELQRRGVCRTSNNPAGDYTEWLVSKALGLKLDGNSRTGFDATDDTGARYQIKGRRLSKAKSPPQLGIIRNLASRLFDHLIAVVFNSRYQVRYAAQIPPAVIEQIAKYRAHQNGHIMHLNPSVFALPGVVDLTAVLQETQLRGVIDLPQLDK